MKQHYPMKYVRGLRDRNEAVLQVSMKNHLPMMSSKENANYNSLVTADG